ncbi:hypothetical protein ACFOU2_03525 [Bacillus songklensis]|uniref:Uncharacterized protein n=1 Tax=Bacillus songklensis TaxID=1069116 RepID=A0ABV8B087_9BACI
MTVEHSLRSWTSKEKWSKLVYAHRELEPPTRSRFLTSREAVK